MKDGIALCGSILDFFPLKKTDFECSVSLLSWVWTYIGVNNIDTLNPEGWFEKGHGFKEGKKNDDSIWMPYHSKGTLFMGAHPFSGRLGVEEIMGGCTKTA